MRGARLGPRLERAGAVLHLEASEFIEAIRGRRVSPKGSSRCAVHAARGLQQLSVNLASVVEHLAFLASGGAVESTGKDETLP